MARRGSLNWLAAVGLALGVLALLSAKAVEAATLNVPSQYPTIQAAIDAAVPGDNVVVADGTYKGAGNKDLDYHGKAITVRSKGGNPATCIIDCENNGRGFYFYSGETAAAVVQGLTVRNGFAGQGGAVWCYYSSPSLTNCTMNGNSATIGGGVLCDASSSTLTNCSIIGNTATSVGGGVCCNGSPSPSLINCTITGNTVGSDGGGVSCFASSPTLTNCNISGNRTTGTFGSGGGVSLSHSSATLTNCTISGNWATGTGSLFSGGGVCLSQSNPTLTNCAITWNWVTGSSYGGGMYLYSSSPTLSNCTISWNTASSIGAGVYCQGSSSPTLTNCILWWDLPQEISGGAPIVTYCDVQGGWSGVGNINADPLFIDPDGPDNDPSTWHDNNHRLAPGSPCIDAGKNAAVPSGILTDLDGHPRFVDDPATPDCRFAPGTCGTPPIVDMGAYEYQGATPRGDLNCDGLVNVNDIAPFALALTDPAAYQFQYPGCSAGRADINLSGSADGADIQPFVDALLGR